MAAAVVTLLAAALGWWVWSRPVSATFAVSPSDAIISSAESTGTGSLEIADCPVGTLAVTVRRAGCADLTTHVEVGRWSANRFTLELQPLPQALKVQTTPAGARITVLSGEREVAGGTGSVETTLNAGPLKIGVSLDGYNTYEREIWLDAATSLSVRLDPAGQLVHSLGIVPCSGAPKAVAITPDGAEVWAAILNGPPSIEIFDLRTLQRTGTIDMGEHGAVELAFTHDGARCYASQMETARVFEIDVAARKILRSMETHSAWTKVVALSHDDTAVYAANWSGDDVSQIDRASGEVMRRIPTADTPRGLWPTPDGKSLYVAGFGGGELQRIDLSTGNVSTVFDSGGALRHLAGDPARGLLYASDMAKDAVYVHDIAAGTTRVFAKTDGKPNTIDLSHDGRVLFVSCRGANNPKSYYLPGPEWGTILLFDTESGAPLDAIVGGNQCTALDVSDDGATLVFSDFLDDRLQVYEVPSLEVLRGGNGGRWQQHLSDLKK